MFYVGCGMGGGQNEQGGDHRLVAFQVGDTPIYYDVFNENVQKQRDQMQMQSRQTGPDALPPIEEAQIEAEVINEYVTAFGNIALAKKAGVKFTDQQITTSLERDNLESQITQERSMLVSQKKLKADANDKEFNAALKKEKLPTVTEIRKQFHDTLKKDLSDDKLRPGLEEQVARPLLIEALQAAIKPTVDQIKATYDTYEFKRILFAAHAGSTVDSQIAKAQADLKAGTTFEQAIDRYSSEPPLKGKKLSDNMIDRTSSQFDMFPDEKPLKSLKAGRVSDIIETPQGKAIYKLIGVKNTAPPDLATNTKKYSQMIAMQQAQTEYQSELRKYTQSGQVSWKIAGLKALYDWFQVRNDFSAPPAEQVTKMAAVIDEAKKAMTATGTDSRPAALAWFASFDSIWTAPGADKVKLRGDRIEVLKALTSVQPAFSLKMELVDLLVDSNADREAVDVLKSAAASNINYDIQGQLNFQEVQIRVTKLSDKKVLTKEDVAAISQIQDEWRKDNEVAAKEKADMKKAQDKAKADNDALMAKEKADKEKALKAAPTTPGNKTPAAPGAAAPPVKTGAPVTPAAPPKK